MRLIATAVFSIILFSTQGQSAAIRKLRDVTLPAEVAHISVDRLGNGYVLGGDRLFKLSTEGEILSERKVGSLAEIKSLDCWNPLRLWLHRVSGEVHVIELLDQKLLNAEEHLRIDPAYAVDPVATAPGILNSNYWILDADNTLKFIQVDKKSVEWESEPIAPTTVNFTMIKSYQGFVFLLDSTGLLYMVNRMGKLVRKIDTNGALHFGVLGEDIYFLSKGKIRFENMYRDSSYEVELPTTADHILATDERLMIFRGSRIQVYAFKPGS